MHPTAGDSPRIWQAAPKPVRAVMWRTLDGAMLEHCTYGRHEYTRSLLGAVLTTVENQPVRIHYRAQVRTDLVDSFAAGEVTTGIEARRFVFGVKSDGAAWVDYRPGGDGEPNIVAELHGTSEIDLGFTPATNALAIWRLGLAIGESKETTAAWLRFPELTIEPLHQRYTRLAERRFLYESPAHNFSAEINVDDLGLVVRYGEIWEQVAVSDGD